MVDGGEPGVDSREVIAGLTEREELTLRKLQYLFLYNGRALRVDRVK